MAKRTDRRAIYVCFPFWTVFAQNPRYLSYVIQRLLDAGWCPVVSSMYYLPNPPKDQGAICDVIGHHLGVSQAIVICFEEHMTDFMITEIMAAKRLQYHVISLKISAEKRKELAGD